MPTIAVDDCELSYEDYGAGPVVLLIHGSPGNGKAWQRVGERLADRFRIVAPDLPGHGVTTPQAPGAVPDVAHAATLIEALVRTVGAPAVLAGHSYGGVVALAVALRGRVSLGALVLLEPVAVSMLRMVGDREAYESTKAVFDAYIAGVEGGEPHTVRTMVDFWFGSGAFEHMPEPLKAYMVRQAAVNVRDVRAAFREDYSPAACRRLGIPVTMLVGGRSPAVTHKIAQAIAAHAPKGSVVTLDTATHAMTTTHAEAVAHALAALA